MLAQAPGDVVDAYDGVVDDYRERHGEPSECDRVERLTAEIEHERRHHQRQRDRYEADQRGAQREQEGREDERQENATDNDRKPQVADRVRDVGRRPEDIHVELHAGETWLQVV